MCTRHIVNVVALIAVFLMQSAFGQENNLSKQIAVDPFVGNRYEVTDGYSLSYSVANQLFGEQKSNVYARFGVGVSGVMHLSYSNEGTIASMLGQVSPNDNWEMDIQVLPRREQYPSLAIWVKGTFGWQRHTLMDSDLLRQIPKYVLSGLQGTRYEFASAAAGLSIHSVLGEAFGFGLAVGLEELRFRDLWVFMEADPILGFNGYHASLVGSHLDLNGSFTLSFSLLPQLTISVQAITLPYVNINGPARQLEVARAYIGIVGIRYSLLMPLSMDAYIRHQSGINDIADTQVRIGLSGQLRWSE